MKVAVSRMEKTGPANSSSWSDTSQNKSQDSCGTSGTRKGRLCKVVGCKVDLHALRKPYCLKRGVCPEHLKADAVRCKGAGEQLWRFCQQCGKMEHLQAFSGKNRSCKDGLARRRQKSMLRQQMQQDWQQQEQQMMAMYEQYQQQQQQQVEGSGDCWGMNSWQMQAGWAAAPQAPAGTANGIAWSADTAMLDLDGYTSGGSSSKISTHSVPVAAPAVSPCSNAAAAAAAQQPSEFSLGNPIRTYQQQLLELHSSTATPAAALCAAAAPAVCRSNGLDAFQAATAEPEQLAGQGMAVCAAAPAPVGCVSLTIPADLSDEELDAIITEELLAAGLQIGNDAAVIPSATTVGVGCAQLAGPAPVAAAAPILPAAAAASVQGSGITQQQTQAAQYAKLHALMAELNALKAEMQQLQQSQGLEQQVGSVMTAF